jgi:hypothetical protein
MFGMTENLILLVQNFGGVSNCSVVQIVIPCAIDGGA